MNRNRIYTFLCALSRVIALSAASAGAVAAQPAPELVLHTKNASNVMGDWQMVADPTAAGGVRLWNPDRDAPKKTPFANPYDYFELTFTPEAGRPYRLWLRGKAENNAWTNDSVSVQFTGSVDASGEAVYRIGSTDATVVSIEACRECGLSGWGWQDNSYEGLGPLVYFTGNRPQTVRIQAREDGISVDQVVLSAVTYVRSRPGTAKRDTTRLAAVTGPNPSLSPGAGPPKSSATEIVIPAANATLVRGNWKMVADSTAALGSRLSSPDKSFRKRSSAAASPSDYFEATFTAEAGRQYRLWIRGKAERNAWTNDSVFVQFSDSVDTSGRAAYRIGTREATIVSLESCSGCGVSQWGWADNGYDSKGPVVSFAKTGTQTLRVQRREDGVSIDQIVLSASRYLARAPGSSKNDSTILVGAAAPIPAPAPKPKPASTPAPRPEPAPEDDNKNDGDDGDDDGADEDQDSGSGGGTSLRVMEWNIHHGVGTDGRYSLDRFVTWIAKINPDVVLLNEVEKYTGWGNEDQPARLKSKLQAQTGRTWYAHFSQEYGQWSRNGKGHLILSKYPFESTDHVAITSSSGLGGGGVASQATIVVNGRTINFVLSHLDPYSRSMRLRQARDVINWAAGYAENRILVGDMNAWPDQSSIAELRKTYHDAWTVATNKGKATGIRGLEPFGATKNGRIDYIFYSKNSRDLVVLDAKTPDTRDSRGVRPSDHRPVVITFQVR